MMHVLEEREVGRYLVMTTVRGGSAKVVIWEGDVCSSKENKSHGNINHAINGLECINA